MDQERWHRISTVFANALALPVEHRRSFIEQECGEDGELRREVLSLLAAHEEIHADGGESLGAAASGTASWGASPLQLGSPEELLRDLEGEASIPEPAPERIGPWRVLEELGRGGMGVVYAAERDDGQYEQPAALKLIKRGMDSDQIARRFLRERQILARMDDPSIARLLDGGVTGDGRPWFAMERIDGLPITRHCAQHQLDLRARLRLFRQVCDAVDYAHRRLVVHRDLKPSNILVDAGGRVKLLDFGIAKVIREDEEPGLTRTREGRRLLTPEYGAPELATGGVVTTATDVYSLGIVLYELLCGERPQRRTTGGSGSDTDHYEAPPPPRPSDILARARREGKKELPPSSPDRDLDTIAQQAIQPEPERRYASAAALRDDLDRYHRGEPVRARADSALYRAGKFLRRHRAGVIATSLVILSLTGGLGAALWQADVAARERDVARQESEISEQVKNFLTEIFRSSSPAQSSEELTAVQILEQALERLRESHETLSMPIRAELLTVIGQVSLSLGNPARSEQLYQEVLELDLESTPEDRLRRASALNALGDVLAYGGRSEEAEGYFRESLEIRLELTGPGSEETAAAHNNLGWSLARQRKLREAIPHYQKAYEANMALGFEDQAIPSNLYNMGVAYRLLGELEKAEEIVARVVGWTRENLGADHRYLTAPLGELASIHRRLGNMSKAERLQKEALDLTIEIWGEEHPETATMTGNYARRLHDLGRDREAEPLARRVLGLNVGTYGEDSYAAAIALDNLGLYLVELGEAEEALGLLQRAEVILTERPPRFRSSNLVRQTRAHLALGTPEEAVGKIRFALDIERQKQTVTADKLAGALTAAGHVELALGRFEAAESLWTEAVDLNLEHGRELHPEAAHPHLGLGGLLLRRGDPRRAREHLETADGIQRASLPETHWRHAEAQILLGLCAAAQGEATGTELTKQGLERLRQNRGAEHWRVRDAERLRREVL